MQLKDLQERLQYLGREALRSDSRIRRKAILDATLRIIGRDGIRAVRHRAVAGEADVPLAATTYYFEDINTLLHDAFVHYILVDKGRSVSLEAQAQQLFDEFLSEDSEFEGGTACLWRELVALLMTHLRCSLKDSAGRNIEMAYRYEALQNPLVAVPFKLLHQAQLETIARMLGQVGAKQPQIEARILLSALTGIEYDAQLYGVEVALRMAESMLNSILQSVSLAEAAVQAEAQ